MSSRQQILSGMLKTGLGTLASRVLGLVRDVVTARFFGAGAAMDMFVMAFTVPNLFRRLFGEGALNVSFVPVFTREGMQSDQAAHRLLNLVMTALAALLCLIVLVGWLVCGMALLSGRLQPNARLFCLLLMVMLPYMPLICLTALQAAALNVKGHFLRPAFAPTLMNVCWITAALLFGRRFGVAAIAVGVTISGALQLAAQAQMLRRLGMAFRPVWDLADPGLRRIAQLMLPVMLGLGVIQLNTFVDQLIAQFCVADKGANSALFYGNHLMQFPLGVLGIALATAVFPAFARHDAERDRAGFVAAVNLSVRTALFISLPCVAMLTALATPMVRVLFERGAFTAASTARTASVLVFYSAGLWAFCCVQVLARAFYAQQDTRTPVRVAVRMVGANFLLNLALVWPMREGGLALASSICGVGNMALLLIYLRRRTGPLGGREIVKSALKCALASAAAGIVAYAFSAWVGLDSPLSSRLQQAIALCAAMAVGGVVFLAAAWTLGAKELAEFVEVLSRRGSRPTA